MPLKKRSAPTAKDSLISRCWLEDALEDGSSLLSDKMSLQKRAAPAATVSFDSVCRHEDGLADGASGDKPTVHSFRRRRVSSGSFSCLERVLRDKQDNDSERLPIVALVDEMICVKKDHDKAETKELCSKISAIIQEMQGDDDDVS